MLWNQRVLLHYGQDWFNSYNSKVFFMLHWPKMISCYNSQIHNFQVILNLFAILSSVPKFYVAFKIHVKHLIEIYKFCLNTLWYKIQHGLQVIQSSITIKTKTTTFLFLFYTKQKDFFTILDPSSSLFKYSSLILQTHPNTWNKKGKKD